MSSGYYCPRCHSSKILAYNDHIECLDCHLNFSIEDLESDIEDDNILAEEEKSGVLDAFKDEFKDEETMRKFVNSLSEDLLEDDE